MPRLLRSLLLLALLPAALALGSCGGEAEAPAPRVADEVTVRVIDQGEVVGYAAPAADGATAHAWLGIPFAQAPVGDLRWRAARAPEAWEGQLEALDHPNWCPQYTNSLDQAYDLEPGLLVGDEDCLYLNIYAPAFAPDAVPGEGEALPVMVWIHGGGNVWGRAEQFDGSNLATAENVIVVVIQYRLGPLGWFAHPALRDTADLGIDRTANFATFDMAAALAWVNDNIAAFGGDADNVTIFGESAGGHNVASLLVAPQAAGLFDRAIIQSGVTDTLPLDIAEGNVPDPLDRGYTTSADAIGATLAFVAPPTAEQLAGAMRTIDVEVLFQAYRDHSRFDMGINPARVIADGVVLPEDGILSALERMGPFNPVPVMAGTTRDETKLFNALDPRYVNRWLGGLVIRPKDQRIYDIIAEYQSRMWQVRGVDSVAEALVRSGRQNVYAYRFDWDEEGSFLFTDFATLMGAAHSWEIPFLFADWEYTGRLARFMWPESSAEARLALADSMRGYWAEFARTGNPGTGGGDHTQWAAWGAGQRIVLDTDAGGGLRMEDGRHSFASVLGELAADPRLQSTDERCKVFRAVVEWTPQVADPDFMDGACEGLEE
jgi:para-nitrobenzyl esterase